MTPKVYRWPEGKPLPTHDDVYAAPRLMNAGRTHGVLTTIRRWYDQSRRAHVIQAFVGRRVAEVEIPDSMDIDHRTNAAIEAMVAALAPDPLEIMHEAQVMPLAEAGVP